MTTAYVNDDVIIFDPFYFTLGKKKALCNETERIAKISPSIIFLAKTRFHICDNKREKRPHFLFYSHKMTIQSAKMACLALAMFLKSVHGIQSVRTMSDKHRL
jgi:catabolite regulation protein CreA